MKPDDPVNALESGFARYAIPYAVGLAPALLVALAWSPSGDWTPLKGITVTYCLPVLAAELFAIAVALREGLLPAMGRWDWPRPVPIAAAMLLIVAIVSLFRAPATQVAATLTGLWVVHALFALSMAFLCGRAFAARDLVAAYLAGFTVFAAEFILFVSLIPNWNAFDWRNGFMAFSHIRHAGYYLAAMAALSMGAMAVWQRRGEWMWAWASASFAFGIALWTGSRGAALAVAGALAAGILLIPAMRRLRSWGGALSAIAAALAAVWLAPAAPSSLMGLGHAVHQTASGDVTTGRTTIWLNVIAAIRKQPLLGYGEGQMHWVAPTWTMAQPHDSILQVTLAWGLVGLACVAVLAVAFAWRAIPAVRREQGALVPAFMAMTAIAMLSLYDASLYYALPVSIFMACAGVIASRWGVAVAAKEREGESQSRRAHLLGVPVDLLTLDQTVAIALDAMRDRRPVTHVALNVAKFVKMRSDVELRRDVVTADIVGLDGMGVLIALRLFGARVPERVPGVDLMLRLMETCAERGMRPYILGARREVLDSAVAVAKQRWPGLVIAGTRDGYFTAEQEIDVVREIRNSRADCLFVAMPTPRKERFLQKYRQELNVPFVMGVGGSVDVLAGFVARAPVWMQRAGLEWLHRLLQEPRKMAWRYISTNCAFAWILIMAFAGQLRGRPAVRVTAS